MVCGLLVVGFLHEQKEKKKIKQRGGQTVGRWGAEERRDKVEQGALPLHMLTSIPWRLFCAVTFLTSAFSSNGAGSRHRGQESRWMDKSNVPFDLYL